MTEPERPSDCLRGDCRREPALSELPGAPRAANFWPNAEHDPNPWIAFDDGPTDDYVVSWTPRWTGKFVIKVVNRGRVANTYTMGVR